MRATLIFVLASAGVLAASGRVAAKPAASPVAAVPSANEEQAIHVLERGVNEYPDNAQLWISLGFAYRKSGDIDHAENAFLRAARLNPRDAESNYMLGLIYEKKHLKLKAEEAWKACLAAAASEGMKDTAKQHLHVLQTTKAR